MMMVSTAVLMTLIMAGRSEAQYFRLAIDEITVTKTTDVSDLCGWPAFRCGAWNDSDEVYFTVAGATRRGGTVNLPRVSPPPPNDYYGMKAARDGGPATLRNIPLWNGQHWFPLGNGESAFFIVLIREQDNAQLPAIRATIEGGLGLLAGVTLDTNLTAPALQRLGEAATELIRSLSRDGDDTIGAFTVLLTNANNQIRTAWEARENTTLLSQSSSAALFKANGGFDLRSGEPSDYLIRVNIQQLSTRVQNFYSMKCLDVENGSPQSGAVVQQYTCQGSPNQAWILSPVGVSAVPTFFLMARHSGHCLDVVWASPDDHAGIQQYSCHFESNQQWRLTGLQPYYQIRNVHSDKCLDVPYHSDPFVQQFGCHGGWNQKWWLSGYVPFAP
jgi:glucosylceramidase